MTVTPDAPGLLAVLRQVASIFDDAHASWALVGGLAVSVHTEPRFTRDVDIAVAVRNDDAAETLVADLVAGGFALLLSLEHQALGRLAAVRLIPPGGHGDGAVVDLLFSSSGIESEICANAQRLEIAPALRVPVARPGHLVVMKLLASTPERPQDEMDLRALVRDLDAVEQTRAEEAARRVEAIGANRGKRLEAELARWMRQRG